MNHFCKINRTSHSFLANIWHSLILNTVLLCSCTQLPIYSLFSLLVTHSEESSSLGKEEEKKYTCQSAMKYLAIIILPAKYQINCFY